MISRASAWIACATTAAVGLAIVAASVNDAAARDPFDAPARALAAAGVLVGLAVAFIGVTGHFALERGVSRWVALPVVGLFSLAAAFAAGELVTATLDRSHSVGYSLAAKAWFRRHWHLNSLGYRDVEWTPEELKGQAVVAVIGDSLTTGHGIPDPDDTFCGLLRKRLGGAYRTLNLGVNAADTSSELIRFRNLPVKPRAVVLAYYGNDIGECARDAGFEPPLWAPYEGLKDPLRWMVADTYLLNYLYFSVPRRDVDRFWRYVEDLYRRPALREKHAAELRAFAAHARTQGVPLVVVLFPYMHDLAASDLYVPWVRELFEKEGVPVVDVRPLVEKMPLLERVVNMNDVHPSAAVHRLVAEALHGVMVARGIVR